MKTWLKLILDIVLAYLGWRKNVTDSQGISDAEYRKEMKQWDIEMRGLLDEEVNARSAWSDACVGSGIGNADELRTKYLQASLAVGHHRIRQPKRVVEE